MSEEETELHRMQAQMRRTPLTGDVTDTGAVRRGVLASLDDAASLQGRVPPVFLFLFEGQQERVEPPGVEPGKETLLAAFFRTLCAREGVRRCFRQGEVLLRDEAGSLRRAVALVELVPGGPDVGDAYWAAWRWFGQGDAGVGVFHGDWLISEGVGIDGLPEPLREWFDAGTASITEMATQLQAQEQPDIRAAFGEIEAGVKVPTTALEVAQALGDGIDAEIAAAGGLNHLLVYALTGRAIERWEIKGHLPCPLEEILRWIAQRAQADALAVIHPCVVHTQDATHRGWAVVGEKDGKRALRTRPYTVQGGQLRVGPVELREDDQPAAWLGVAPTAEIDFAALGWEDAAGNQIPDE